jgi:hypothetical protein
MSRFVLPVAVAVAFLCVDSNAGAPAAMRFRADFRAQAEGRQAETREKLYALMMGGRQPERVGLDAKILRRIEIPAGNYVPEELTLQTLPDRRAHVWLARPAQPKSKVGAALAINGHGGSGEQVIGGFGCCAAGGVSLSDPDQ